MNISAPFIRRPIATSLLTVALLLAGVLAYTQLPVAPLPQFEYPVVSVSANLPGASPETMASSVATPLERQFGRIAGVNQMTSSSQLGSTNITLQFDLNRNIDAAARDVQASINAALGQLPAGLPTRPSWRGANSPGSGPPSGRLPPKGPPRARPTRTKATAATAGPTDSEPPARRSKPPENPAPTGARPETEDPCPVLTQTSSVSTAACPPGT